MPFRSDILTPTILTSERSLEFMQFWQSLAFGSLLNCFQNLTYGFDGEADQTICKNYSKTI